ncbi:MAG TPA: hypothetical protein VHT97_02460 [Acidimicrobiales bacterium]|nr:hypothetical protein [Acidimicrobiales bacterium]
MRKLIGLGLTAVTSATMAFGAVGATPAHATVSPPGSLVGQVCAVLPAQLTGILNSITALGSNQTAAVTDLATKQATFGTAQSDLVTALVDYVKTVDAGGSVGAKALVLQDAVSVYSDKAAAWANAWTVKDLADRAVAVANINNGILGGLNSGLC